MKKIHFLLSLILTFTLSIGQVWGAEDVAYTLDGTQTGGTSDYAKESDITQSDITWKVMANTTMNPWRVGGKNLDGADRTIYNTVAIPANVTKIEISHGAASSVTVNSMKVEVASNANFSTIVSTLTPTFAANSDVIVTRPKDTDWTGKFYRITYNLTIGSSNKFVAFNSAKFYEEVASLTCAAPTFSPDAGTFYNSQEITLATTTSGASIYYTTDGSTPSSSNGTLYEEPFEISATTTIKAIAVKNGATDSEVAEATYTKAAFNGTILEITKTDFTTEGYDANAGDHEKDGVTFTTAKVYQSASSIQFQKTNGLLYNKTDLGEIAKIDITTVSGKANNLVVYAGTSENPSTTTVTGSASGSVTTYTFASGNGYFALKCNSTGASNVDPIKIYYTAAAPAAVAKPTISGTESFLTSTTVTLACTTDGATIYYTTDGSDPKTSATKQTGTSFSLTESATVRAIAELSGIWSAEATSKTFTKVTPKTTAAELRTFATSSDQSAFVQLDGWKVTFVSGNNAYIIDPNNEGVILNNASHGYVAGDVLNDEVVEASVKLASGRVQLSGFTSTNITATSGTVTPDEITDYSTLTSVHQSRLVTLKGATYNATAKTFSDGTNTIEFYDQFSVNPTLVDGANYDVTGIVIYYKSSNTEKVEIAPRLSSDVVPNEVVVIPTAANLAALKAATRGTYVVTLTNAVVTYVNGRNIFIEEGTTGALIFLSTHSYEAGNCLNGDYQVTTEDYNGKFEITSIEPQAGAATTTATVPLTTVTIAALNANFASYESRRVKIVGVNVTDALTTTDRNGAISDGTNTLALYAGVANTVAVDLNANIDIIGYPGFNNTNQQLTVWRNEDITVNEKDDPELSYSPSTLTIEQGDDWSAPQFNNPHTLSPIIYSISGDAVATVSDAGVIALVENATGTATITASFAGDATYNAGSATYTITVNEAGTYSMSFDLTRASYDDAADAEVVWNSNVVTITAQQSTGTKVTNYLAGNYSGTTLIAETRLYENNNLIFTPKTGITITKVEWIATTKAYAESLAKEGTTTTWTNATAALDADYSNNKKVIITPSASGEFSAVLGKSGNNKGTRGASVIVYYTAKSEASKLTASIAIENMNMAVGDDDILLSAIEATSNPNKKAISYAVTSGTAVSITGEGAEAALHAVSEGSAIITATIPDNLGNYTGATKAFTVTVAAAPVTLQSITISGTASDLEYTDGEHFNPAGLVVTGTYSDASTAPITTGIDWTFDPNPLTEGTTSVSVTATVSGISSSAFTVNGLTVAAAAAPTSGNVAIVVQYDGKYYAMSTTVKNSTGFKPIEVEKSGVNIVVTSEEDKEAIQWLRTVGTSTTFQNGEDKYLACSADANTGLVLLDDASSWEWDATAGCYKQPGKDSKGRTFYYNDNSGNPIFRAYTVSGLGGSGYSGAPEFVDAVNIIVQVPEPTYETVRDNLTAGNYYTICYPKAMTAIRGGLLYSLEGKDENSVYMVQEDAPLVAGRPYILYATAEKLEAVVEGNDAAAGSYNGMHGTLSAMTADDLSDAGATHMLYNNSIRAIGTNNSLPAGRAYIILDEIPGSTINAQEAPGRVRAIPMHGNVATDIEATGLTDQPAKVMKDGQLFILRGEKLYDMTGRLVK